MNAALKRRAIARLRPQWRDDTSFAAFTAACKSCGTRNLVQELLDPFIVAGSPETAAALSGFRARPWYSAAELARLWPIVCVGLAQKQTGRRPSPATLAKRLIECGLPRLKQWNGSTEFKHNGKATEFFIVQDVWRIANQRYTQIDFDRSMTL